MALAPSSRALSIIRSIACRRLSSSSSVYWATSPLRSVWNAAVNPFANPMLRTTRPKQAPRLSVIRWPGRSSPVVMGRAWAAAPAEDMTARVYPPDHRRMVFLQQVAVVVDDYDEAIGFFVGTLGFELVEDSPARTNDGRDKRWVVVRPPGAQTGLLLARADGAGQRAAVGEQFAGRVGLFLRVDDFDAHYERMVSRGIRFLPEPRQEPYGRVAVFVDVAGNRWDLLG